MQLDFAQPAPALAHLVATYYLLSEDYSVMEDVQRADTGHLRIFLGGSGYYEFAKGKRYPSTRFFLNGPFTQHMRSVVQGPVRFIGVALFPESWGGLLGQSAADFTDRAQDAAPLLGDIVEPWFDQLLPLSTIAQMAPVMDAWLMKIIKPVRPDRRAVIQAIRAWLADSMFPDIADLYATLSLSERQIMRISNAYYGSPPRALARTYGALKTASSIVMNEGRIPEEAIAHYADAPHLIREVKRVTGQTPRQLMHSSSPVMRITLHPSNFKELEPLP
jgi:AraC-like DNA-binding protein